MVYGCSVYGFLLGTTLFFFVLPFTSIPGLEKGGFDFCEGDTHQ